jgi:hypothetical protein
VSYETKIEQEQKRIIITPLTKGQTERSSS